MILYVTTLRGGTGVLGLEKRNRRSASAFSFSSAFRLASISRFLRASSLAALSCLFSSTHIISHVRNLSARLFSSSFSISCFCRSSRSFSSSSSISLPWGTKQKSKSSSLTAAMRGSSSEVTLIPLSLSRSTFAK